MKNINLIYRVLFTFLFSSLLIFRTSSIIIIYSSLSVFNTGDIHSLDAVFHFISFIYKFLLNFDFFNTFYDYKIIIYNLSVFIILTEIHKQAITGNLLGGGNLNIQKRHGKYSGNARFQLTLTKFEYISYLFANYYSSISTLNSKIILNPKPNTGKSVVDYKILTISFPALTALHSIWYVWLVDLNKFVKIVPQNILSSLTPLSLALWLQDDSYWHDNTVWICTGCFTKIEVELLIYILNTNLGIIAKTSQRKK